MMSLLLSAQTYIFKRYCHNDKTVQFFKINNTVIIKVKTHKKYRFFKLQKQKIILKK